MRIYTRFKATGPRRHRGRWVYRLLALLALALLGCLLWLVRQQPPPAPLVGANDLQQTGELRRPAILPPTSTNGPAPSREAQPLPSNPPPHGAVAFPPALPPVETPGRGTLAVAPAASWPRAVQNVFEAQLALARQGISPGSLDGLYGFQTRAALQAFQRKERLPVTGALDGATRARLFLEDPPLVQYTVTSNDVARLLPLGRTWLGKSQQPRLDYETVLELAAEKAHAHPNLIRQLNPQVDWGAVLPGLTIVVPNAPSPVPRGRAASVRIHLSARILQAFDPNTNLLAHFPCSIARQVEKRPVGELRVIVVAPNPDYTFDPDLFTESAEAQELGRKLILPPGPNNPVGTAWIGLSLPGYGIHGTPRPEEVGRTESHGCFRLANWNAEYLAQLVVVGTLVYIEP